MRSRGGSPNDGFSSVMTGDGRELACSLSAMRGHSSLPSKSARESSPNSNYAGIIFRNFLPPN